MGQEILGKPRDRQDAAVMLRRLSGNTHEVHTAVAAAYGDSIETVICTTSVLFTELSEAAIEQYLLTDEPWDKAGAYAIQGYAGAFVSQIKGSYSGGRAALVRNPGAVDRGGGTGPPWLA